MQSAWLPAAGDETYEIIRRRLFQPLDADGERARDETVKAFADMYRRNAGRVPARGEGGALPRIAAAVVPDPPRTLRPALEGLVEPAEFQRTRGVLRFMANVVGVLWQQQSRRRLILPARVPVAHDRVRANVLYPLDAAFGAVVDREVDGDGSLPAQMEANPTRRISQARAATRAARSVFLCTAPLVGRPNAGLTGQGLRLACAEPGDQLAIFGEALRELSERASYLYEEGGRYWFSTQPTLNRLADDRAKAWPAHEVDDEIVGVLREDAKDKEPAFIASSRAPDDPIAIEEADAISLVILGPATPHAGRGVGKSKATEIATDTLMRHRNGQRRYRNTLLFVAADEVQLATAREAMRRALAWESIGADPRQNSRADKRLQEQMTQAQLADARDKARNSRDGAVRAVRTAWNHVLFPIESSEAGTPFDLDHLAITARERSNIPAAVYDKASAKGDGIIKDVLGGETLATHSPNCGRPNARICRCPRSPTGSRPMFTCRSCATAWCSKPRSATPSRNSTQNLRMPSSSMKGAANTSGWFGKRLRPARHCNRRCSCARKSPLNSYARQRRPHSRCVRHPSRAVASSIRCRHHRHPRRQTRNRAASTVRSRSTWFGP